MNDDKLRALASGTRFADLEVRKAILRVMDERDAEREVLHEGVALLQWVRADRPSAHSDALWNEINDFLAARALGEGKP